MLGIVLGNGPSKAAYNRSGDIIIGCNFPGDQFSVDATVVCDEEIVYILKNNPEAITCPMIISTKVFSKMKEYKIEDKYTILAVFIPQDWFNAAHYAANYLLSIGCTQIDIWGCDSIFVDTTESTTDVLVPKEDKNDMRFIRNWRKVWNEIFDDNPMTPFNVMKYQ